MANKLNIQILGSWADVLSLTARGEAMDYLHGYYDMPDALGSGGAVVPKELPMLLKAMAENSEPVEDGDELVLPVETPEGTAYLFITPEVSDEV